MGKLEMTAIIIYHYWIGLTLTGAANAQRRCGSKGIGHREDMSSSMNSSWDWLSECPCVNPHSKSET